MFGHNNILLNIIHGNNGFAEKSKILIGYRKVILLNYKNNYIERLN